MINIDEIKSEIKALENTKRYKRKTDEINKRIEANNKLIEELQSSKEPVKIIEKEIDIQLEEIKEIVESKDSKKGRKKKEKDLTIEEDLDKILEVIQPF